MFMPHAAKSTVLGISASGNMMFYWESAMNFLIGETMRTGLLPPSSRVTFFKFEEADAFKIARPVAVDPVKALCRCPYGK